MQLANPIWLWALGGLLIPIGIHLFSRREGKVIPMGSLRYLRETPAARYKNIRLNEIILLLLRCFLVTLLVLLLAGPETSWFPAQDQKWLIVERGIENSEDLKPLIGNLEKEGFQLRSLARDFPLPQDEKHAQPFDSYWSAATHLTSLDLDSAVVISYNYLRNFKGERIATPSHIKWLSYPAEGKEFIAKTFSIAPDSIWIRKGTTSPFVTRFETVSPSSFSPGDSLPVTQPEALEITLFTGEDFAYDEKILMASLKAVQSITPHKLRITSKTREEANSSHRGITIWLAEQLPSAGHGNMTIAYRPCHGEGLPLLLASARALPGCLPPKSVSWILTKRLSEDIVLREHLTLQLARLILPSPEDEGLDQRVLPEPMMWSSLKNQEAQRTVKEEGGSRDVFLMTLFILLLLAERAVAYNRNQ
jgi:hypothetical protein